MTGQRIQQETCYQWFKQRLILSVSELSISQRSQIKEDTVEPSVPAREFNLKAYAAITWHNDPASLGLEPRLADHRSQAAGTATLSTAPPRQADKITYMHTILYHKISFNNSNFIISFNIIHDKKGRVSHIQFVTSFLHIFIKVFWANTVCHCPIFLKTVTHASSQRMPSTLTVLLNARNRPQ